MADKTINCAFVRAFTGLQGFVEHVDGELGALHSGFGFAAQLRLRRVVIIDPKVFRRDKVATGALDNGLGSGGKSLLFALIWRPGAGRRWRRRAYCCRGGHRSGQVLLPCEIVPGLSS